MSSEKPKLDLDKRIQTVSQLIGGLNKLNDLVCGDYLLDPDRYFEPYEKEFQNIHRSVSLEYAKVEDEVIVRRRFKPPLNPIRDLLSIGATLGEYVKFYRSKPDDFRRTFTQAVTPVTKLLGEYLKRKEEIGGTHIREALVLTDKYLTTQMAQLIQAVGFLGLDEKWILVVAALQSQEIAEKRVAEEYKIELDKRNVERILRRNVEALTFRDIHDALALEIERHTDGKVKLPTLQSGIRKDRNEVIHGGYNPQLEEVQGILAYTFGFLDKCKKLITNCRKTDSSS